MTPKPTIVGETIWIKMVDPSSPTDYFPLGSMVGAINDWNGEPNWIRLPHGETIPEDSPLYDLFDGHYPDMRAHVVP